MSTEQEKEVLKAEKAKAKAAAKAEKAAAKAAEDSAGEQKIVNQIANSAWKSIANQYVFVREPQTTKALTTANIFAKEAKVRIVIFPTADEPDARLYWGGINGFFFSVVIGVEVELPKSLADHITKSRTANARATKNIIVVNPFTGEKVNVDLLNANDETRSRLSL